jgi:DNA-binding Xre family transcriptional regulator
MKAHHTKGKLVFTIKAACVAAGIKNPHMLMRRSGLDYKTCRKLFSDKVRRVEATTFAALCLAINCKIESPLMSYVPPKRSKPVPRNQAGGKVVKKSAKKPGARASKKAQKKAR